jgi:nucleotide-binding universal stress UspA family protein
MFSRIVVPLDGSPLSERALDPARALARYDQAELVLVRAADPERVLVPEGPSIGMLYPDQSLAEARREAQRYLTSIQTAYGAEGQPVRVVVDEGDAAGAIVDAAEQTQAHLIVMSSHGYSGAKRWLLGSVAEKVLNGATCPVWVVRAPSLPQHVLITLDGSPLAEEVLVPALAVARGLRAQVTLLRIVPEYSSADLRALDECERGMGRRFVDEVVEEAADYLCRVADRFGDEAVRLNTAVRSGPPADSILEFAERHEVDLVAMTTHGRTGLRRWIYGSVTHKVLDQMPVSMLVVRSRRADAN